MNADRVLVGGTVLTLADSDSETEPEASALAFHGDRITLVGETEEVRDHVGPDTDVIDLEGRTALPGFIDTHLHLPLAGRRMTFVNCRSPPNESISVSPFSASRVY